MSPIFCDVENKKILTNFIKILLSKIKLIFILFYLIHFQGEDVVIISI